ncbi:CYTH domain-containing protein [Micromonospora endophytica]|uniref:CYTH domain-containing protein n=1 Tax=Micromonospora endophytica TaxID=515350 RepID=A0A2W2CHU2_9ACTN|nr:CYTH domain-containing protein [Micromonospora endophytica]PZF97450.1 hypothetical protein C1I93_11665 [Micromonospora endophytica]RIW41367.1 CYTH domain-containing protein [Micromonospora endophytica]
MEFYPTIRIVRTRRTARLGRMVLCLDEVDGLGTFFEIEAMVSGDQPAGEVQQDLDAFARSLGTDLIRTTETYDSLLWAALSLPQEETQNLRKEIRYT